MDRLCFEEIVPAHNACSLAVFGVFGRLFVEQIVDEYSGHDPVGGVLLEHLIAEVGHASIGPSDHFVGQDAHCGSGWGDHGGHSGTSLVLDDSAPMLHALGQSVVRTLHNRETVDKVDVFILTVLLGLEGVLAEFLPSGEDIDELLHA